LEGGGGEISITGGKEEERKALTFNSEKETSENFSNLPFLKKGRRRRRKHLFCHRAVGHTG